MKIARDLTGMVFGKLTVININNVKKYNNRNIQFYLCQCKCGNSRVFRRDFLTKTLRPARSCGRNCKVETPKHIKKLINTRVGGTTAIGVGEPYLTKTKGYLKTILIKCDCGKEKSVQIGPWLRGNHQSCGCNQPNNHSLSTRNFPNEPYWMMTARRKYDGYKRASEVKGREFNLTIEQYLKLSQGNCHYCGLPPYNIVNSSGHKNPDANFKCNGIDRVVNSIGYIIDNCVSCCAKCNKMKHAMDYKEFIDHLKILFKFRFNK